MAAQRVPLHAVSEVFGEEEEDEYTTHPLPPRPQTAFSYLQSSSIRIIDRGEMIGDNPQPVEAGAQLISPHDNQFLSPHKLRQIAGVQDLTKVVYLELSVNTSTTSLGNFGLYLTQLNQLRLYSSRILSIRDLGTSLGQLRVLWMAGCHLRDLDGLAALPSLQELYVANNNISDISLISLLTDLEVLDIERNFLCEEDQLGYLCLCPQLSILTLSGNPIVHRLQTTSKGYRRSVRDFIPHIKILDETPYEDIDVSLSATSNLFSPSLVEGWRSMTKGDKISPLKLQERAHQTTAISSSHNKEDSSDLTHGINQVICGNPVKALRARNNQLHSSSTSVIRSSGIDDMSPSPPPPLSLPPPPPPSSRSTRPHTASDFRSRRYVRSKGNMPPRSHTTVSSSTRTSSLETTEPITASIETVNTHRVLLTLKRT